MRAAQAFPVIVLALAVLTAGCVSATKPLSTSDGPTVPKAEYTELRGGIEGYVVDPERIPIVGAVVLLVGTNLTTNTTAAGAFAFSDLEPIDYFISITHAGFRPARASATVPSGNLTKMFITMEPLPPPVPVVDDGYTFVGYVPAGACIATTCQMSSRGVAVPEQARAKVEGSLRIPGEDWRSVLFEMDWVPATGFAGNLKFILKTPQASGGTSCAYDREFAVVAGPAPLRVWLNRTEYAQARAQDKTLCEIGTGGVFFEIGPSAGSETLSLYLDQRFTVYGTISYNAPLAGDYTRLP